MNEPAVLNELANCLDLPDEKKRRDFKEEVSRNYLFYQIAKTKTTKTKTNRGGEIDANAEPPKPSELEAEFAAITHSMEGLRGKLNGLSEPAQALLRHLGFLHAQRSMNPRQPLSEIFKLEGKLESALVLVEYAKNICRDEVSVGRPAGKPEEAFILQLIRIWKHYSGSEPTNRDARRDPHSDVEYPGPCHGFLMKASKLFCLRLKKDAIGHIVRKYLIEKSKDRKN